MQSSADPQAVALTVKGVVSLTLVQTLFGLLPMVGVHPSFSLGDLGDALYTVVYGGLSIVSAAMAIWGAIRKLVLAFHTPPATATPAA